MDDDTVTQPEEAPAPAEAPDVQEPVAPAATEEPEATAADFAAPDAIPEGVVTGSVEDARSRNWVPYEDRFKPVLERAKSAEAELARERERTQFLMDQAARQQVPQTQPAPTEQYFTPEAEFDPNDPEDVYRYAQQTRKMLQETAAREEARRQTASIRADINRQISELGFVDPERATRDIEARIAQTVANGGAVPDIHEVARHVRQREIAFEKQAIDRYVSRKKQPDAAAAAPVPASPPVVQPPPEKKKGWGNAAKRIAARAAGRYQA